MFAVIETGGKQYRVSEGDVINVEKISQSENASVEFNKVLLVDSGEDIKVGTPLVEDAKVTGTVLEHGKDKKVTIFKYKPKNNYRRKKGHRQPYTQVRIDKIEA